MAIVTLRSLLLKVSALRNKFPAQILIHVNIKTNIIEQDYSHLHSIEESQEYTRSYDVRYVAEIRHLGLNTFRVLIDKDSWILDSKVEDQFHKWDIQWEKMSQKGQNQAEKEANQSIAEERTREAKEKLQEIENILAHTLGIDDTINWDSLKDKKAFDIPNPKERLPHEKRKVSVPKEPAFKSPPTEPDKALYEPRLSFFDKLIKSKGQKKLATAEMLYEDALTAWRNSVQAAEKDNLDAKKQYEEKLAKQVKRSCF